MYQNGGMMSVRPPCLLCSSWPFSLKIESASGVMTTYGLPSLEVAWQMVPKLLVDRRLSGAERWKALFPLATWFGYLMFAATFFAGVAAQLTRPSLALAIAASLAFGSMAVMLFAIMLTANRSVGRATPVLAFTGDFVLVLAMSMYISWANFCSVPGTLLGRRRVFARTPKQGGAAGSLPTGR